MTIALRDTINEYLWSLFVKPLFVKSAIAKQFAQLTILIDDALKQTK